MSIKNVCQIMRVIGVSTREEKERERRALVFRAYDENGSLKRFFLHNTGIVPFT